MVHIDDLTGIVLHLVGATSAGVNAVATRIVPHKTFMRTFSRHLRRPIIWRSPARLMECSVDKEPSSILLEGLLVRPEETLASGYAFRFADLDEAIDDLVKILS